MNKRWDERAAARSRRVSVGQAFSEPEGVGTACERPRRAPVEPFRIHVRESSGGSAPLGRVGGRVGGQGRDERGLDRGDAARSFGEMTYGPTRQRGVPG